MTIDELRADGIDESAWNRVSPKYVVVDLLGNLVSGIFVIAISFVPLVLFGWEYGLALPAFFAATTLLQAILAPRRVRSIGYQLRADDLLFKRGLMWRRVVAVPYGRMQLVDINRGPIARLVGLSELKFVTAAAATGVVIPGLPEATAEELRDKLVELAESRRAGL